MPNFFAKKLLTWYHKHGRHDLPWQHNPTPYRVWISEIMLQQTQVSTVISYYQHFMRSFPTLKSLVAATEDHVLSHWSGLGYYARARNIYKTAKIITDQYQGKFPVTVDELEMLPGIGRSTAGAIVSFSQQTRAVICDGNVKRVLSRYFAIDDPKKDLWEIAEKLTPKNDVHHYNQAIMDLGATLCTRTKPRCSDCPLSENCIAFQEDKVSFYPVKIDKKPRPTRKTQMMIIENKNGEIALIKRPSQGIWGGLWSFPECDLVNANAFFQGKKLTLIEHLPIITHQFTHFTLEIQPARFQLRQTVEVKDIVWYKLGTALPGGIATPVKKLLGIK